MSIEEVTRSLQAVMREEVTGEVLIANGELLTLFILAATLCSDWEHLLILYVSDNENPRSRLTRRQAKNWMAKYRLRILERLDARHVHQA